jgi:hypothetical protein
MDDFITVYLSRTGEGDAPSIQEKEQLIQEIALFSLASHLFWGIWGIVNINQEIEFGYWVSWSIAFSFEASWVLLPSRTTPISGSTNTSATRNNTSRLNLKRGTSVISKHVANKFRPFTRLQIATYQREATRISQCA